MVQTILVASDAPSVRAEITAIASRPDVEIREARSGPEVTTYDATGRRISPDEMLLRPGRLVLSSLLPPAKLPRLNSLRKMHTRTRRAETEAQAQAPFNLADSKLASG